MDSIITDIKDYCYFCGRTEDCDHHFIFGSGKRPLAEEDGIKAPICDSCHTMGKVDERIHDNPMAEKLSKMYGQAMWERQKVSEGYSLEDARNAFIRRYGKSYI